MTESVYKVITLVGTHPESWDKAAKAAEHISGLMSGVVELDVPLEVDAGTGKNWVEAHS